MVICLGDSPKKSCLMVICSVCLTEKKRFVAWEIHHGWHVQPWLQQVWSGASGGARHMLQKQPESVGIEMCPALKHMNPTEPSMLLLFQLGADRSTMEDLPASTKADSPLMEAGMDSWKPKKLDMPGMKAIMRLKCNQLQMYLIYLERIDPEAHVGFNSTTYP